MNILAIDMGWSNSVSCILDTDIGEIRYQALASERKRFAELIQESTPELVVIEAGPMAGWVRDMCVAMSVKLLVLNTNDEPWQWRNVKKKTDRKDALKLARIAALGTGQAVHVPERSVRQWRQLIYYRDTLMNEMVSIKNRVRAVLLQEERKIAAGRKAWDGKDYGQLQLLARELAACGSEELWCGMLQIELKRLEELDRHLATVEAKLDSIASADERVKRLQQVPGVGPRTAELVVAMIDDPKRFGRGREVGCYAGLTPRKFQSGKMDRDGGISRGGNGLLRKYLVQAVWSGKRCDDRIARIYERIRRGNPTRTKKAVVAAARHLLVWLWAMLRDKTDWRPLVLPRAA
jgi:transposase